MTFEDNRENTDEYKKRQNYAWRRTDQREALLPIL
jgi:hypothetical protein